MSVTSTLPSELCLDAEPACRCWSVEGRQQIDVRPIGMSPGPTVRKAADAPTSFQSHSSHSLFIVPSVTFACITETPIPWYILNIKPRLCL